MIIVSYGQGDLKLILIFYIIFFFKPRNISNDYRTGQGTMTGAMFQAKKFWFHLYLLSIRTAHTLISTFMFIKCLKV